MFTHSIGARMLSGELPDACKACIPAVKLCKTPPKLPFPGHNGFLNSSKLDIEYPTNRVNNSNLPVQCFFVKS